MEERHLRQPMEVGGAGQVFPPELSLFQVPPLSASYSCETYVDYRPVSGSLNAGSLEYVIPPSMTQMIDLAASRHHLKLRIVKGDGSDVNVAEEVVGPINYIGATLFETVQVYLNQALVTSSGGQHHGYRAIIEALLDTSRFEKSTILQAALFYKDAHHHMSDLDKEDTGFTQRWQFTGTSRPCQLIAPLITDLAQQERLIIPGVEIGLKWYVAKPAFTLMSATEGADYKWEIMDAFLRIKKKTPQPAVLLGINSALDLSPALYPLMQTQVRQFLIHRGQYEFNFENLFEGLVPCVMTVGFVTAESSVGQYKLNPFEFLGAYLQEIRVSIEDKGCSEPPMKFHYDPNGTFALSSFMDGYQSLFRPSGEDLDQQPSAYCDITPEDYHGGYQLITFRFASGAGQKFLPVIPRGNLKLSGSFSQAPTANLHLIVYCRFPTLLTIDKSRRISY